MTAGQAVAQSIGLGIGIDEIRQFKPGASAPQFVLGTGTSSTDALGTGTSSTDELGVQ